MQDITVQELKKRLDGGEVLSIIDVRGEDELNEGMIPGVKHIPTSAVQERVAEFKSEQPVYVVCASGTRSKLVVQFLNKQNINNVVSVTGGMHAWIVAGFDVV